MTIIVGNDHAAVNMKEEIVTYLKELGHQVVNYGVDTAQSCDYPEIGEKVGQAVAAGEGGLGILFCGTGIGMAIVANKVRGVRAAVCTDTTMARLARQHNNANILTIGARITGTEAAKDIVRTYLESEFEGGRHEQRVDMIRDIENRQKVVEK